MRIVAISDTHGRHKKIKLPEADTIVVTGDVTPCVEIPMLGSFLKWLSKQPHGYKVIIAGNHDWCFQEEEHALARQMCRDNGIVYLEDRGVNIEGVNFYGSPWQPEFCNWAFNLKRGMDLLEKWQYIPDDTDVLLTHGPPAGILDQVYNRDEHLGCEDLRNEISNRIQPKVHVFGHIHSAHGNQIHEGVRFVNASVLGENYMPAFGPEVFDV